LPPGQDRGIVLLEVLFLFSFSFIAAEYRYISMKNVPVFGAGGRRGMEARMNVPVTY
jgi:hypothetical protein